MKLLALDLAADHAQDNDNKMVDENDHRTQFLCMASCETKHSGLGLGWRAFQVYKEASDDCCRGGGGGQGCDPVPATKNNIWPIIIIVLLN